MIKNLTKLLFRHSLLFFWVVGILFLLIWVSTMFWNPYDLSELRSLGLLDGGH